MRASLRAVRVVITPWPPSLLKVFSADRAFAKIEEACNPGAEGWAPALEAALEEELGPNADRPAGQKSPAGMTTAGLAALWHDEHLAHFSKDVFPRNNIFQVST